MVGQYSASHALRPPPRPVNWPSVLRWRRLPAFRQCAEAWRRCGGLREGFALGAVPSGDEFRWGGNAAGGHFAGDFGQSLAGDAAAEQFGAAFDGLAGEPDDGVAERPVGIATGQGAAKIGIAVAVATAAGGGLRWQQFFMAGSVRERLFIRKNGKKKEGRQGEKCTNFLMFHRKTAQLGGRGGKTLALELWTCGRRQGRISRRLPLSPWSFIARPPTSEAGIPRFPHRVRAVRRRCGRSPAPRSTGDPPAP